MDIECVIQNVRSSDSSDYFVFSYNYCVFANKYFVSAMKKQQRENKRGGKGQRGDGGAIEK